MLKKTVFGLLLSLLTLSACQKDEQGPIPSANDPKTLDERLTVLLNEVSPNRTLSFFRMPESDELSRIPQDPRNPLTPEKVVLGKFLYHETAIAISPQADGTEGTFSCASCHFASAGFQAGRHQGIGEGGSGFGLNGEARAMSENFDVDKLDVQPIRSPSTLNTAYQVLMLWNGQFGATGPNAGTEASWTPGTPKAVNELGYQGLETQAIAGLTVHRLLAEDSSVENIEYYKPLYDAAFEDWPETERYERETTGLAIAAYERTLLANEAPFQRWLKGDYNAMNELEKEGALLFFGKAGCGNCHTGPALNEMDFYALGMADLNDCPDEVFKTPNDAVEHLGRGGFTGNPDDLYQFKVPQLYNLKDSPFYGHGATFNDIRSVVTYKNTAEAQNPDVPAERLDPSFVPLGLNDAEIDALTAFLSDALYDPNLSRYEPNELPSGQCFPNADIQSMMDLGCQ